MVTFVAARVGMVGIDDRLVPRQRGGAADHLPRVAVSEDQARVGKDRQQGGQIQHVLRGLEDPWPQRAFLLGPAHQPEQIGQMAVGRRRILALAQEPTHAARGLGDDADGARVERNATALRR